MAFKVTARTLLQLGSELISSDAIAFYELIKNAFDANSPKVVVRVVIRIPHSVYEEALENLYFLRMEILIKDNEEGVEEGKIKIKEKLISEIYEDSYEADKLRLLINNANSLNELEHIIETANFILIRDTGEGMSYKDLEGVYLTIGTPSRLKQKQKIIQQGNGYINDRPILGEKGIGRLSVMRLGDAVKITTTKKNEPKYNELEIDWGIFADNANEELSSIDISPKYGVTKPNPFFSGTDIFIFKLRRNWSQELLGNIASEQLSKFIDPFQKENRSFIDLWFNNQPVIIRNLNRTLFNSSHAIVEGGFIVDNNKLFLYGNIDYKLYNRKKTFTLEGTHLTSKTQVSESVLKALGPFTFKFYWFNNRIVKELDGIGNITQVRELIKSWAGGLMVYRDGFRVYPYGSMEDDWLQIDPIALGKGGYKVNRRQIIGKVDIGSLNNPTLTDQTNREGLRDCPEKTALIKLLQHVLWVEFKTLLDKTEKEKLTVELLDLEELDTRLERTENILNSNLERLIDKFPQIINEEKSSINAIRDAIKQTQKFLKVIQSQKDSMDQQREVTLNLASLGLMVDIVAHELNRSTEHVLRTINEAHKDNFSNESQSLLNTLSNQLQTLQTRLKILDPLSPAGRQTKTHFDISDIVYEVIESHKTQFERHKIKCEIHSTSTAEWRIKAVKGMFVQILENLISNSVYWIKQHSIRVHNFLPEINILIDKPTSRLLFTDNGPGVPIERYEDIFLPFYTTKPPGEGKGLGLYLSSEIAKYHGASLELQIPADENQLTSNTFILNLQKIK